MGARVGAGFRFLAEPFLSCRRPGRWRRRRRRPFSLFNQGFWFLLAGFPLGIPSELCTSTPGLSTPNRRVRTAIFAARLALEFPPSRPVGVFRGNPTQSFPALRRMRCRIDDPHRSWVASLADRTNPTTRRVLAEELLGLVRRSGQCSQPPSGTPAPFERQPLIGVQPSLCREPTFSCDNTSGGRPLRGARGPMSAHPKAW